MHHIGIDVHKRESQTAVSYKATLVPSGGGHPVRAPLTVTQPPIFRHRPPQEPTVVPIEGL